MVVKAIADTCLALYSLFVGLCPQMPTWIWGAPQGAVSTLLDWGLYLNRAFPVAEAVGMMTVMLGVYLVELPYRFWMWVIGLVKGWL